MRFLLATLEYPPQLGGVASYYGELVSAWPQEDSWMIFDDSRHELLRPAGFWRWRRAIFSLSRAFRREKADLLLLGQVLPLAVAAFLASWFGHLPYGVFLHGMDLGLALSSPRKRCLLFLALKRSKVIICANSEVRRRLLSNFPSLEKKIILSNPGARLGCINPDLQKNLRERFGASGKKVILSLGRLVARKGFDAVISSLPLVRARDFIYIIAGSGPDEERLKKIAAASSARDHIIFAGSLSEEEKWSCLALCDIFIMPSREIGGDFEGFGIVYLEANLAGKPVIAGRSGGVADAVEDGVNGLMVDPENYREIAETIDLLLLDRNKASLIGENGRQRALELFDWRNLAAKLAIAIRSII